MIYQDLYWQAATFYAVGVLGFWLVMWKITSYMPWRPLRWWCVWLYLCVVLTPWQGTEPEVYYAPVIIVTAFDVLDVGLMSSLALLIPMLYALIAGTTVIVFLAIALRIRELRRPQPIPHIPPELGDPDSE